MFYGIGIVIFDKLFQVLLAGLVYHGEGLLLGYVLDSDTEAEPDVPE